MSLIEDLRRQAGDRGLFEQVKEYALEYMATISDRRVFPSEEALAGLQAFQEAWPDEPTAPGEILELLHRVGSPATSAQTGGRYFGFVNGGVVPASLAAKWLADAWDQNAGLYVISPTASVLESVCEKWLVEMLGLPRGTGAGFVSGTSMATFCGLAAGRDELLRRQGWDAGARGLFGAPEIRVIVGAGAHSTVYKALALLGLGRERLTVVPADDQGRMRADLVPELDGRTLLVLQAGHVSTGAFDPFADIVGRARAAGAWVHVDGAFGLWASASPRRRYLTAGADGADSWSADAHKTLNAPYDSGVIFCRDPELLARSMQMAGSYIIYGEKRDGMLYTPEMSRRARAVELWALLKALGRRGAAELVDGLCDQAALFAAGLRALGFSILNEVCFNQVLCAAESPGITEKTLALVQRSGECWCGGAAWRGAPAIRLSVCSFMTTREDIDRSLAAFAAAREKARREDAA
ncbi:MAG: aminotransferase class V-fold PLP-dependent enzyme [Pseudomonadota bacterium]